MAIHNKTRKEIPSAMAMILNQCNNFFAFIFFILKHGGTTAQGHRENMILRAFAFLRAAVSPCRCVSIFF